MTGDGDAPTKVGDPPAEAGAAALARYERRMRPLRIAYAIAITAVVLVALVIVKIAYSRGEISHAHLHTVPSAPPSVASGTPATTLTKAWSSTDTTATGTPLSGGTVVTFDQHTVRGRDARTGDQTWSYTRTDRSVCTAIQSSAVTIAVYRLHGNCDELTALDSGTGRRLWTRTLDKDGAEFNGPASYAVYGGTVMFTSQTSIYAISPSGTSDDGNGGLDYWTFHHVGCTIHGAVIGASGALISQTCTGEQCDKHKFCGDGTQLLLRDNQAKYDDSNNNPNPDAIKWNDLGTDLVPTSAGVTLTARDQDGRSLHLLNAKTGADNVQLPLTGDSGASAPSAFTAGTDADLVWIGGRTYALGSGATSFRWQTPTVGVPTMPDGSAVFAGTRVLAPTGSAAAALDGATGKTVATYPVSPPATGSTVYPLGTGLLVAGPDTVAYR